MSSNEQSERLRQALEAGLRPLIEWDHPQHGKVISPQINWMGGNPVVIHDGKAWVIPVASAVVVDQAASQIKIEQISQAQPRGLLTSTLGGDEILWQGCGYYDRQRIGPGLWLFVKVAEGHFGSAWIEHTDAMASLRQSLYEAQPLPMAQACEVCAKAECVFRPEPEPSLRGDGQVEAYEAEALEQDPCDACSKAECDECEPELGLDEASLEQERAWDQAQVAQQEADQALARYGDAPAQILTCRGCGRGYWPDQAQDHAEWCPGKQAEPEIMPSRDPGCDECKATTCGGCPLPPTPSREDLASARKMADRFEAQIEAGELDIRGAILQANGWGYAQGHRAARQRAEAQLEAKEAKGLPLYDAACQALDWLEFVKELEGPRFGAGGVKAIRGLRLALGFMMPEGLEDPPTTDQDRGISPDESRLGDALTVAAGQALEALEHIKAAEWAEGRDFWPSGQEAIKGLREALWQQQADPTCPTCDKPQGQWDHSTDGCPECGAPRWDQCLCPTDIKARMAQRPLPRKVLDPGLPTPAETQALYEHRAEIVKASNAGGLSHIAWPEGLAWLVPFIFEGTLRVAIKLTDTEALAFGKAVVEAEGLAFAPHAIEW